MTFYCPKHGLHIANSFRLKPDHRYTSSKVKPEIKAAPSHPKYPTATVCCAQPSPVCTGTESLLPSELRESVGLVTSQRELKERVKSIEDTLEKYGSSACDAPTGPTNARSNGRVKVKHPTKPLKCIEYDSNRHYLRSRAKTRNHKQDPGCVVARCPPSKLTGSCLRKPICHNKSGATMATLDEDDEEIAQLFRELENLATEGRKIPNFSLYSPSHSTKHHKRDNVALPNKFRCKGCGDVQNIYMPNQFSSPDSHFSYLYSPFPLQSYMDILNPKRTNNSPRSTTNTPFSPTPSPNPFGYSTVGPNVNYMPYYPYIGLPFAPFGTPRDLNKDPTLADILRRISESLSVTDGGKRPRSRSVGTQSVEDLNSERSFEDEEDIVLESKGGGGLQSAPPDGTVGDQDDELHLDSEYFDKDDQESHDHQLEDQDPYFSGLPQSAVELRELELSAWAASKWWHLVKTRRALRREYGFADDDEEFCTVEYRNKDSNLQSEQDDLNLDLLAKKLNKLPNKSDESEAAIPAPALEEVDDDSGMNDKQSNEVPKGFNSFKQLSVAAKASYKWSQLVEKRRLQKNKKKLKRSKSP